tara:strand:+ start:789 stop:1190 length:402 start_codon:yes stop_codon:yes gene_type:complete
MINIVDISFVTSYLFLLKLYIFTIVNMESINDRIQKLLIEKGISASEFSKKIDVQRSSISHIINGRNKPSLEIVTKICKVYPDVKLDWLILGENYESASPTPLDSKNIQKNYSSNVEKIILLLKDGTFKVFEN